jgi:hypothetical protein
MYRMLAPQLLPKADADRDQRKNPGSVRARSISMMAPPPGAFIFYAVVASHEWLPPNYHRRIQTYIHQPFGRILSKVMSRDCTPSGAEAQAIPARNLRFCHAALGQSGKCVVWCEVRSESQLQDREILQLDLIIFDFAG